MKRLGLATLTTALLLPASLAKADALLFPYVVTSPTVASIISVVNKDNSGSLFLQYFPKLDLAHNSECAIGTRMEVGSGDNDLVSFEVNGKLIGPDPTAVGGPLFNDPGGSVSYAGSDFTMGLPGTITRAYLIVDDNDDDGEHLYGEAIMLETHGGAAWGYVGYNAAHDGLIGTFDASATGIVGANDVHGEALDTDNGTDSAPFTLLPANEWNTLFFVTPLADGQQRLCDDCSVTVEVSQSGGGGTDGMFDRDTNPLAGNSGVNVVCVSGVSIQDLLPASVEAVINTQGGYGFIDIDTGGGTTLQGTTTDTENAATVIKLEYNKVQFISPNALNSFNGTVNSAVWLRNRDNSQGVGAF